MSGLPRSGSSLLSALFNQNPRFYCGPSSPICSVILGIEDHLKTDELYAAWPKENFKDGIISSVLPSYYSDIDKPIVIDKNRSWTRRIGYLSKYFNIENPKIICTVRNLTEILTSFIDMIHRSNSVSFVDKSLSRLKVPIDDFARCQWIASDGPLGRSYTNLKIAFQEGYRDNLYFVEYSDLVSNPKKTMQEIYNFIEEEYYEHNFDHVEKIVHEDDGTIYGLPDMHDVRPSVKSISKNPNDVLPEKVIQDVSNLEFWRSSGLNLS